MKCDTNKLFIATTITVAIAWIVCAAFVAFLPTAMMTLMGHMIHANLDAMKWSMTTTGFFVGLFAWSLMAGVIAWLTARIYNGLAE
jgi:hypothetical protein